MIVRKVYKDIFSHFFIYVLHVGFFFPSGISSSIYLSMVFGCNILGLNLICKWCLYSVLQLPLQTGVVTIASLSMWDGCTRKSCDMLLIVPGGHEKDVPKISVNVKTIPREQPSASGGARPLGPGGYFNGQRDIPGGKQVRTGQQLKAVFGNTVENIEYVYFEIIYDTIRWCML